MFTGVIFYSNILTELLDIINQSIEAQEAIQLKLALLKEVSSKVKLPTKVTREIQRLIKDMNKERDEKVNYKFDQVNPKDVEQLQYEAFSKVFKGINLFSQKDK